LKSGNAVADQVSIDFKLLGDPTMVKRIALFLATNLAVILVLSVVLRLLGVDRILDESGSDLNYEALLVLEMDGETLHRRPGNHAAA
jgi:hypothetical protein